MVLTQKVKLHPNKPPPFLLLCAITNEKTVKLMQRDRLLFASKTWPAETSSNNSRRYTLLSHIPWVHLLQCISIFIFYRVMLNPNMIFTLFWIYFMAIFLFLLLSICMNLYNLSIFLRLLMWNQPNLYKTKFCLGSTLSTKRVDHYPPYLIRIQSVSSILRSIYQ